MIAVELDYGKEDKEKTESIKKMYEKDNDYLTVLPYATDNFNNKTEIDTEDIEPMRKNDIQYTKGKSNE